VFSSFRRYLFEESAGGVQINKSQASSAVIMYSPPKLPTLQSLDYSHALRPSVLLGYLMANGPSQLSLPFEVLEKDIAFYIHQIVLNYQSASSNTTNMTEGAMKTIEKQLNQHYENNEVVVPDGGASTGQTEKQKVEQFYFQLSTQLFYSHVLPVNSFYIKDSMNSQTTGSHNLLSKRFSYLWKQNPNEKQNWELIQKALDLFFQRIAVTESNEQKQLMRIWYETILDLGSQFFS
jgi:hypothetical protein